MPKWARWTGAAVVAAIIAALAGAIITTGRVDSGASSVANWFSDLFSSDGPTPTEAETVTSELFASVRNGEFWEGRPKLYPSSRRYLLEHFKEYDPREPHGSYLLPQEPVLSPAQLAVAMPVYAGHRVTVLGQIRLDSLGAILPTESHIQLGKGGKKIEAPNANFIAQIAGPGGDRSPLAFIEYADPASPPLPPGQWVLIVGIPIASGGVKLSVGGFVPGVYIVAGSVEPVRGPRSVLRSVHRLEVKLNRARKRCQLHPDTWWCKQIKSTTGRL
jgi:hypothetical protein